MTDYFGFTMAALNESGSVFANPCKGDKNMSTLMYRPFGSWASNSEVSYLNMVKQYTCYTSSDGNTGVYSNLIVFYLKINFYFFQIQWSMRFEGEEVKVVALGVGWVAAVTSLNFLRIFTEGGLQVLLQLLEIYI